MSASAHVTDPARGYRSEESRRRFTIVAGVLGAAFFLAQFLLPMVVMLLVMMPTMMAPDLSTLDVDHAALWQDEVWVVAQSVKLNWRDRERTTSTSALRRLRLEDLSDSGPPLPLNIGSSEWSPALLPIANRLWVIGTETVGYYENGSLTRLRGPGSPAGASRPFVYAGHPAVLSLGSPPTLSTLQAEGEQAKWIPRDLPLNLPADLGALRAAQAAEAGGRLYLFAELCTESPERCSLRYREVEGKEWLPLADGVCSCALWISVASGATPAVVLAERRQGRVEHIEVINATASGSRKETVPLQGGRLGWSNWSAFVQGSRVVLLSESIPGSLRLMEVEDGKVVRSARKPGSFPFGPNMLLMSTIPQVVPILLSLALAFVLTVLMRRHRLPDYVVGGEQRTFASVWQRALAQLVDLVPILAGFLVPMKFMWRMFSDPESLIETGPAFPLKFFALFAAALLWVILVLLAYSYFEGRTGKTPGKWLVGIRVLGTDLQPCGFWRALVRNLLTFIDGFFNFLAGALMVALTENWQRLGDLAARTIVVVDEKPA